jgi:anti-anti-sigma factor
MTLLSFDIENGERAMRIALKGELDISSAGRVEEQLGNLQGKRPELLVLDLRELEFMDSTGLRLIVRADEAARASGTRFVIVRGPEQVQRVFEIVGLDSRLDMADAPPAL